MDDTAGNDWLFGRERNMKVVGYLRVSTSDQDYGIDAQREVIELEARRRDWTVEWIIDQGETGKNADRPGLACALAMLDRGEADALVVSKLDRLSRSVVDFGQILQRATRPRGRKAKPWGLVALDVGIDMTQPTGRLVAHILIAVAEWEGDIISERTKAGLAQAKARGVQIGAVSQMDPAVVRRMKSLRSRGWSFDRIATRLNEEGVPTPRGARFHGSTVAYAVRGRA
ncbi:recombinase family protein [Demequina zhanjiangensis]|uniref:Recombinase family protein n=1 Tax=Demequina zhanjiangensis TaxID=3051659 RepID=A0ABT8G350_9MICO|nr:recombinase family protein [Demequina sp. SYSU T00b26]MDN4473575.1 recombinase family protein [Demequina sp. SYSU T00b26]